MKISELNNKIGVPGFGIPESVVRNWLAAGLIGDSDMATGVAPDLDVELSEQATRDIIAIDLLCRCYGFDADSVKIARGYMLPDFREANNMLAVLSRVAVIDPQNYLVCSLWLVAMGKSSLAIPADDLAAFEVWSEPGAVQFKRIPANAVNGIHPSPIEFVRPRSE